MADPRVVREWLEKADEDLEFAISVVEESSFYFHARVSVGGLDFLKKALPVLG